MRGLGCKEPSGFCVSWEACCARRRRSGAAWWRCADEWHLAAARPVGGPAAAWRAGAHAALRVRYPLHRLYCLSVVVAFICMWLMWACVWLHQWYHPPSSFSPRSLPPPRTSPPRAPPQPLYLLASANLGTFFKCTHVTTFRAPRVTQAPRDFSYPHAY